MIRICTQIKYDDDDDDDDVRGTGSPPKVNQFFRLMGPCSHNDNDRLLSYG